MNDNYNITPTKRKSENEKVSITPELIRLADELGRLAALPPLAPAKLKPTVATLRDWPIA